MDIKVDFSPDNIQEQIVKGIVDSSIGKHVIKAIEESIKPSIYSNNDPIREAIHNQIVVICRELIKTEYADKIKAKIKESLSDGKTLDSLTDTFIRKIVDYEF